MLLAALRERSPELRDHSQAVTHLALRVGERLGLDGERLEQLRWAAELHDVGKLAIPDAILEKPGSLDEGEWRFMRGHTIIGERIVGAAPSLVPVAGNHPGQPRAGRRQRLSRWAAGRGDPARGPHRGRL